ncbi:MAG: DUF3221 domain-containing protein [Actinobacteria bacterium]|nr:DUF3221 domain-containing protein [Actinomycetota bacterium]
MLRQTILRLAVLAAAASFAALFAGACGGSSGSAPASPSPTAPPAVPADITGTIHDLTRNEDSGVTVLLVVDDGAAPGATLDRASVTVTSQTVVWMLKGGRGTAGDLGAGQMVSVWFDGPVAESYPVQAKAGVVRILLED